MKKATLLALILIAVMLSSTFIHFISLFFQPGIPTGNIVEYELNLQQKVEILKRGKAIMEFFYEKNCEGCEEKIWELETIAKEYEDKVFLEKILTKEGIPKLHLIGFNVTEDKIFLQERFLEGENITRENVMSVLCEIMLYPPVECVKV